MKTGWRSKRCLRHAQYFYVALKKGWTQRCANRQVAVAQELLSTYVLFSCFLFFSAFSGHFWLVEGRRGGFCCLLYLPALFLFIVCFFFWCFSFRFNGGVFCSFWKNKTAWTIQRPRIFSVSFSCMGLTYHFSSYLPGIDFGTLRDPEKKKKKKRFGIHVSHNVWTTANSLWTVGGCPA